MSIFFRQNIRNDTKLNIYKNVAMCCMICYKIDPIVELCHIYSSTKNGPRPYCNYDYLKKIDPNKLFNDENYIIVLCPNCHRKIDYKNGKNYTAVELIKLKEKYISNFNKVRNINISSKICNFIFPMISLTTGSFCFYYYYFF